MPYLKEEHEEAVAAQASTYFKKPAGKVNLLAIHVRSKQGATFTKCMVQLYDPTSVPPYYYNGAIGLFHGIVPEVANSAKTLWRGHQEWPHNFELELLLGTQVALEILYYTVEYEIIEPKKKGWGE